MSDLVIEDTGTALYNAILQYPHDIQRRLVYADWLDENDGEEQAEFIRLGVELLDVPPNTLLNYRKKCECVTCRKINRIKDLSKANWKRMALNPAGVGECLHGYDWSSFENIIEHDASIPHTIRRGGFIDEIRCSIADFMRHARDIAAKHPVTKWVLTDVATNPARSDSSLGEFYLFFYRSHNKKTGLPHGHDDMPNHWIPRDLIEFFDYKHIHGGCFIVDSDEQAMKLLQDACYKYARHGLFNDVASTKALETT